MVATGRGNSDHLPGFAEKLVSSNYHGTDLGLFNSKLQVLQPHECLVAATPPPQSRMFWSRLLGELDSCIGAIVATIPTGFGCGLLDHQFGAAGLFRRPPLLPDSLVNRLTSNANLTALCDFG